MEPVVFPALSCGYLATRRLLATSPGSQLAPHRAALLPCRQRWQRQRQCGRRADGWRQAPSGIRQAGAPSTPAPQQSGCALRAAAEAPLLRATPKRAWGRLGSCAGPLILLQHVLIGTAPPPKPLMNPTSSSYPQLLAPHLPAACPHRNQPHPSCWPHLPAGRPHRNQPTPQLPAHCTAICVFGLTFLQHVLVESGWILLQEEVHVLAQEAGEGHGHLQAVGRAAAGAAA